MLTFKNKIIKNFLNSQGWKSKNKYLIIESDDWGAIRTPSKDVYELLLDKNIEVDKFSFDKYDSLESEEDLKLLFKTLEKFKDNSGQSPVITAYHLMANPNFDKIESSEKKIYHYESVFETYKRKVHTEKVPLLIEQGIKKGIYIPQFHGREHIHIKRWMQAINSNSEKEKLAFENRAIISSNSIICKNLYQKNYFAGQDYCDESEFDSIEKIHLEGLDMFENTFGYKSLSFTSQGGFWGDHILPTLANHGVILIGGRQFHPNLFSKHKRINKLWGKKNELGQIHWRRNCQFEPSRNQDFPWVEKCIKDIEIAFRWNKPAVISSHRVNFIGSIFEENRTSSLLKLEELLSLILTRWPDVKFISTNRLAEIMKESIH